MSANRGCDRCDGKLQWDEGTELGTEKVWYCSKCGREVVRTWQAPTRAPTPPDIQAMRHYLHEHVTGVRLEWLLTQPDQDILMLTEHIYPGGVPQFLADQ